MILNTADDINNGIKDINNEYVGEGRNGAGSGLNREDIPSYLTNTLEYSHSNKKDMQEPKDFKFKISSESPTKEKQSVRKQ